MHPETGTTFRIHPLVRVITLASCGSLRATRAKCEANTSVNAVFNAGVRNIAIGFEATEAGSRSSIGRTDKRLKNGSPFFDGFSA
jgi:hypothetical protein